MLAIDVLTGQVVKKFKNDTSISGMDYSIASTVAAIDENGNGFVDKVYVGDLGGQMWRIGKFTDTSGNPPASKVYRAARIILSQPGLDGYFASGSGVASQEQFHSKEEFVGQVVADFNPNRVLDVGCNTGFFSALAAQAGASSSMVAYSRSRLPRNSLTPATSSVPPTTCRHPSNEPSSGTWGPGSGWP